MKLTTLPDGFERLDQRVEAWCTSDSHGVDSLAHLISAAADRSKLWVAIAVLRALRRQPGDGRAAVRAVAVVGVESAVVHAVVKRAFRRRRPSSTASLRFGVRRPPSSSFPSGHAASAATAAVLLSDDTAWTVPLACLAVGVGWSRIQTRLHHPTDVLAGWMLGTALGLAVRRVVPTGRTAR